MLKHSNLKYGCNLQIAFIVTLTIFIVIFYSFPEFSHKPKSFDPPELFALQLVTIPQTTQEKQDVGPPPAKPLIPIPDEEIEIAEYLEIAQESMDNDSFNIGTTEFLPEIFQITLLPKQIVEVIPAASNNCKGEIVLRLKIGIDGRIISYELLKDNTNSQSCLEAAIEAVKKSQWEGAIKAGKPIEFWINKKYRFNL